MFDIEILKPELTGLIVTVHDQYGAKVCGYNALELAAAWLKMDNDSFYEVFGFNWIPPHYLRDKAQNMLAEGESAGWRLDPYLMRQLARRRADGEARERMSKLAADLSKHENADLTVLDNLSKASGCGYQGGKDG